MTKTKKTQYQKAWEYDHAAVGLTDQKVKNLGDELRKDVASRDYPQLKIEVEYLDIV